MTTFMVGNRFVCLAAWAAAAFVAYKVYQGQAPFFTVVIAWVLAAGSHRAFQTVKAYRQWQRDWAAMGGEVSTGLRLPRVSRLRMPRLRVMFGVLVWGIMAVEVMTAAQKPGLEIPVMIFWGVTVVILVRALYRKMRKVRAVQNEPAKASQFIKVALCLPLPPTPSTLHHAYASLPEFCQPLLKSSEHAVRNVR